MDDAGETRSDARMETSEGAPRYGNIETGRFLLLMTIAGDRPPRYGKVKPVCLSYGIASRPGGFSY